MRAAWGSCPRRPPQSLVVSIEDEGGAAGAPPAAETAVSFTPVLGSEPAPLPTAIPARVDMRTAGGGPCGPWEAWPQPAPADMSQHARPLMPITNTSWKRRDWRVVSEVFPVMFIIWKKCQGGREAGLAQHGCCRHLQSDPVGESAPSLSPFLSL